MAIIEHAYANGLAGPKPPKVRTGKKIAVVGSGPSGLARCRPVKFKRAFRNGL